jgi:hypothetical protein
MLGNVLRADLEGSSDPERVARLLEHDGFTPLDRLRVDLDRADNLVLQQIGDGSLFQAGVGYGTRGRRAALDMLRTVGSGAYESLANRLAGSPHRELFDSLGE